MTNLPDTTVLRELGLGPGAGNGKEPGSPTLLAALRTRSKVLALTQQTEDAVLRPRECGAWPHALRAALASRIARQNRLDALAGRYAQQIGESDYRPLADAADPCQSHPLAHVVGFMDKVALSPREVVAGDVAALQAHGVTDADIVRLAELNAFMAYQCRLIAGLATLQRLSGGHRA